MDMNDLLDDSSPLNDDLNFNQPVRDFLSESARWGKFLAIVGFVIFGLGLIFPLLSTVGLMAMGPMGFGGFGGVAFLFFLLILGIFFLPIYYLYNFSTKMQKALANEEQWALEQAFGSHKSLFKFYGILMIIVLALNAFTIIFGLSGLLNSGF